MALPAVLRVKISSEEAGSVSLTPVVVEDMPLATFLPYVLANTGKDSARVAAILKRGTLVSGASRFRWDSLDVSPTALDDALALFPSPEPDRPFSSAHCTRIVLSSGRRQLEISRLTGMRHRWFRRPFWPSAIALLSSPAPLYAGYLYRQREDHYRVTPSPAQAAELRNLSALLTYRALTRHIRLATLESIDLFVERAP